MNNPDKSRWEHWYALLALTLLLYSLATLPFVEKSSGEGYYDNTTILTQLNVSNVPPLIENVVVNDNDTLAGASNIILSQGTTDTIYCNATVSDRNGYQDLTSFNATLFHYTNSSTDPDDNNAHYTSTACTNSTIAGNATALIVSCTFEAWFYANNGTWTCNMTAIDKSNATGSGTGSEIIDPLYALDLNVTVIDYGTLEPGQSSQEDQPVLITNFGNMDINISVEGFGQTSQDGYAMFCDTGNITVEYEKYSTSPGLSVDSMTNLTTTPLLTGIDGLTLLQNQNDNGNSTNTTYWKIMVPTIGEIKGYCNGSVIFSAIGPV